MAYTRKDYAGGAAETTISSGINGTDTSITIAAATGWPSGSNGPFVVVIDEGTASEEKVLCASRTGTTLTVTTRGYDGTTGTAHSSGANIAHCLSAVDFDEANYTTVQTVGKVTTAGDLLVASGTNAFTRLAKGSNSTVLTVDSGGTLGYTTVTSAMITDGTIAAADLATDAVETAKIKNAAVTADKVAAAVAGNGLTGGAGSPLAVGAGTGITVNAHDVAINSSVITTGAWTTFTPTLSGGFSLGNATYDARYSRTGRTITFYANITMGSTSSFGTGLRVALPVAARATGTGVFNAQIAELIGPIICSVQWVDASTVELSVLQAVASYNPSITLGTITSSYPQGWSSGDFMSISGTYEAAS